MRAYVQVLATLTAAKLASAIACPYGAVAEAGLLSDADLLKCKAVKRVGIASEPFASMHEKKAMPISIPSLTLPLGGGLRESIAVFPATEFSLTLSKLTECCSHLPAVCLF